MIIEVFVRVEFMLKIDCLKEDVKKPHNGGFFKLLIGHKQKLQLTLGVPRLFVFYSLSQPLIFINQIFVYDK